MNKRGMTWKEVGGLILGVAVAILLIFFAASIFVPMWDREDKIAESYLETLEKELVFVDDEGAGEFFLWKLHEDSIIRETSGDIYFRKTEVGVANKDDFFLVYFGDALEVDFYKKFLVLYSLPISRIPVYYEKIDKDLSFNAFRYGSNKICICYIREGETFCDHCENLKYPASFEGGDSADDTWIVGPGVLVNIKKEGEKYVFSKA
jgi:hypothetical protein